VETRLTLIRHGQSMAQTSQHISGHDTCEGLTDLGRAQAEALRDRLLATNELGQVDAVYTSILRRAIETHEILQPALGRSGEAVAECEWCEIHPGEAEGWTWAELAEKYPTGMNGEDPYLRRSETGESWAEFYVRVGGRLRRVATEHPGEHVVVVCHGGVVGASFIALGEQPVRKGYHLVLGARNTSMTQWVHRDGDWHLALYNDAAHLASLDG
jgi:probable phosphoglycerate mutase